MRARPSITILLGATALAVGPIGIAAAAAASTGKPTSSPAAAAPRVRAAQEVPITTAPPAPTTTTAPPPPPANPRDPADFIDPVDGGYVISSLGWRSGRRHEGVDFKGPNRAPVFATFAGVVTQAGPGLSGYGYSVTIDHGEGVTTLMAHLSSWSVLRGDVVKQGEVVGTEGSTGNASTPHVHYEVRLNGVPRDPSPYLSGE